MTNPNYLVIGHRDLARLVEVICNAPIPRVYTDPMMEILTTKVAPLPSALEAALEESVLEQGGTVEK